MSQQPVTIEVAANDSIDTLAERLVAADSRSINLVVPPGAAVPSTLDDFERLRELESKANLKLTITVDPRDRTRFGLAKILSFNVSSDLPSPPAPSPEPLPTPPSQPSRIAATLASLPRPTDLPPDLAGMNFDEAELALTPAAPPPPEPSRRSRTLGSAAPTQPPPPRREREARPASSPSMAPEMTAAERTSTGSLKPKVKGKTSSGRLVSNRADIDADAPLSAYASEAAPPAAAAAPRRSRPIPPPRDEAANTDRVTTATGTMKLKIKSKTSAGIAETNSESDTLANLPVAASSEQVATRPPSTNKSAAAVAVANAPTLTGSGRLRRDAETVRRQRENSRVALFALLAVLIIGGIGAITWAIIAIAKPTVVPARATVTLVPRTITVNQSISVPIALSSAGLNPLPHAAAEYRASPSSRLAVAFAPTGTLTATLTPLPDSATAAPVAAQLITLALTETATVDTTSFREEPRGTDVTTLKIVNPNEGSVTIGAGATVRGGGTTFAFPNAVVVPASNLLAGVIGTTYVKVQATTPGPTGVNAFTLVGYIAGVKYENTDNAAGGYMEKIPTVAQADFDNLKDALTKKVEARVPDEINNQLAGRTLITQTVALDGDPSVVADHNVNDDAAKLTVTVSRHAHAFAFRPDDARNAASAAVKQSITNAHGVSLDQNSIKVNDGQLEPIEGGYIYRASASATATYLIDPNTIAGVRQIIASHKVTDDKAVISQAILARYPTLAKVQINFVLGEHDDGTLPRDNITINTPTSGASTPTISPTKLYIYKLKSL